MDILAGAALAKQAVDNVRQIVELSKKFEDITFKRKILELEDQVIELTRERRALDDKNRELAQQFELRAKTEFRNPYYYEKGSEIPLCKQCYESSDGAKRIHLPHPPEDWSGGHKRTCTNCHTSFFDEGNVPKQRTHPTVRAGGAWS